MSICNSKKRETGPDPRETLQPATSRAAARPIEKKEGQTGGREEKEGRFLTLTASEPDARVGER